MSVIEIIHHVFRSSNLLAVRLNEDTWVRLYDRFWSLNLFEESDNIETQVIDQEEDYDGLTTASA